MRGSWSWTWRLFASLTPRYLEASSTASMSSKAKKSGREPRGKKSASESTSEETKPTTATASSTSVYNAPTVKDILEDQLTKVSLEYWAPGSQKKKPFDSAVITKIYNEEIGIESASTSRLMLLELSFYLEKYVCSDITP